MQTLTDLEQVRLGYITTMYWFIYSIWFPKDWLLWWFRFVTLGFLLLVFWIFWLLTSFLFVFGFHYCIFLFTIHLLHHFCNLSGWFARDPSILHRVGHILLQINSVEPRRVRNLMIADDLFQLSKVPKQKTVHVVNKVAENLSGCKLLIYDTYMAWFHFGCVMWWVDYEHHHWLLDNCGILVMICFDLMKMWWLSWNLFCCSLCRPASKACQFWSIYCIKCTQSKRIPWAVNKCEKWNICFESTLFCDDFSTKVF